MTAAVHGDVVAVEGTIRAVEEAAMAVEGAAGVVEGAMIPAAEAVGMAGDVDGPREAQVEAASGHGTTRTEEEAAVVVDMGAAVAEGSVVGDTVEEEAVAAAEDEAATTVVADSDPAALPWEGDGSKREVEPLIEDTVEEGREVQANLYYF